ncbi:DUF1638 domain-containing protein [Hoeflea prorocentri]|uniref:DUF1638 domain-containing protein n=1 Tax=Hoeflea prorocentri TaxID=1922333 RepID=A0A9X3UGF3_9HYPH|nr:DUF1638 domain-containing protein [Hoeflea prorocentri]MCY6380045.1 DUF1638 domain-containing protein [Hoeflea prorocentri]MDA5397845.1 DUF1638 domain-containing protein [Hoeflea prorocentri]
MSETATSVQEALPVRIIGCGAIAREILAVCEANGLTHIDLVCLPAKWHLYPEKIAPGVQAAIREAREEGFSNIYVAYADCGTGGMLDRVCEEEDVGRIAGPHCYSFFAGNEKFETWDDDIDAFFLTDFLARQFEAFIVEPLALDRHPELRDMYFGNYRKLVYLSQKADQELQEKARQAAEYLGLEYEYRFTGYGDLRGALMAAVPAATKPDPVI